MIPLRDSVPSRSFPVINLLIISINAFVFFQELNFGPGLEILFRQYGLIPAQFFQNMDQLPASAPAMVVPVFSSMFLHGGWLHFIGNMWFLWIFGDNVEDSMGHLRYIFFYLLCGIGAAVAHLYFNQQSLAPTIGASGAIAGVMGAYLMLHPRGRVLTLIPIFIFFKILEVPAFVFLLFWMLLQTFQGVISLDAAAATGGVAWWAHIGGFIAGAILVFFFRDSGRYYGYDDSGY